MRFPFVYVLGAHPDDEMGCAGLIYQLKAEGSKIHVVTFSECSDLNGPELVTEWQTALSALGINPIRATEQGRPIVPELYLMDYPNRRLAEHRVDILATMDTCRRNKPDLVLCPTTYDTHQDHAEVAHNARRVFKDTTILGYELPLNHVGQTGPLGCYVPLTPAAMGAKRAHAAAFKTQELKAYMKPEYIEALARVRGLQSGVTYAEAFEVIRWIL